MDGTADEDDRVVVVASEGGEECPLCGEPYGDHWPVAVETAKYKADVTHACPNDDCAGAARVNY